MSDIERLISRYLDRELSPEEEGTFHRILSESPEARRQLREMETIRSAARRIPTLTMPTPQVEALLFQQLFAEESESVEGEQEVTQQQTAPLLSRISAAARRRSGVLATALLLATLLGGGGFWIASESGTTGGERNRQIAERTGEPTQQPFSAGISARRFIDMEAKPATTDNTTTSGEASQGAAERVIENRRIATSSPDNPTVIEGRSANAPSREDLPEDPEKVSVPYASGISPHSSAKNDQSIDADSWPPSSLNLLAGNTNDGRETSPSNPDAREEDSEQPTNPLPAYSIYAAAPHRENEQTISASYRHGLAYVENSGSRFTTQDFSVRVEGRFDNRHRLSLAVGQSPLLVERTTHTLPTGMAMDGKGATIMEEEQVEHFSKIAEEVWAGIGYGYALIAGERIRLEPGVNFGVGERSLRFSAELPIRYRLTERLSLDLIASVSRVQPHDQIPRDIDREYDRASFLHVDEEQHPVFTATGVSIGVSFDLGQ